MAGQLEVVDIDARISQVVDQRAAAQVPGVTILRKAVNEEHRTVLRQVLAMLAHDSEAATAGSDRTQDLLVESSEGGALDRLLDDGALLQLESCCFGGLHSC